MENKIKVAWLDDTKSMSTGFIDGYISEVNPLKHNVRKAIVITPHNEFKVVKLELLKIITEEEYQSICMFYK